jgi:hypothetical protein
MANAFYTAGFQNFLEGDIDFDGANIRIILIDEADDTIDLANDDMLDDRAAGSRVATSGNLASKTTTGGVADAADVTLSGVSGDPSESIDTYLHSGTESTSPLITNHDTGTGLPVTPNGGDIIVAWNASGMFSLA